MLERGRDGFASATLGVASLSVRRPSVARPVLRGLDLRLARGGAVGISGASGAGKTTLLHVVSGLVPWMQAAEITGDLQLAGESILDLDPGQRAHLLSTCLDRPDAQLFLPTVGQELATARRLYGATESQRRAAEWLGVDRMLDRQIVDLSSGQRQRVALAVALSASPRPVLLDEPTAHLDESGVDALRGVITEASREGGSFLVSEQAGWRLQDAVGTWFDLAKGRLVPCAVPEPPTFPDPQPAGEKVVLAARGVTVKRGDRALLSDIDLELREGEIVMLTGANGAGKSTLARVLAGLGRAAVGVTPHVGRVTLMLPVAELQLFSSSVAGEVAFPGVRSEESARVLRRHRLEHLAARAPWSLSRGERQRLVHAALDLLRPTVMIVDEPAQGLDPSDLHTFVELMHRRAEKGRAYLVISHRRELAAAAHRHLEIVDGRIVEVSP